MSSDNWCTPVEVKEPLHKFFPLFKKRGLDPCSNPNSIMEASRVYTCGALYLDWDAWDLYENPPYSNLLRFTTKAVNEVHLLYKGKPKELVRLVPVATSTEWWSVALKARRPPLLVYTKRIPFLDDFGKVQTTARFDSVLQVWARGKRREEEFCDLFAPLIRTVVSAQHHTFPRAA